MLELLAKSCERDASVRLSDTCVHVKLENGVAERGPGGNVFVVLSVDRKMHSGMKTYGCELCGKSFLDSLRLRMHLLSHSGKEIKPTQKPQARSVIAVELAAPPGLSSGFTVRSD